MAGVVPRFARNAGSVRRSGGALGEDNDAVFRQMLGLSDGDLERLAADEVI